MKKLFFVIVSAAALVFAVSSCDKFLDAESESTFGPEEIYSTPTLAVNAVASIAQCFGETNSYRGRILAWSGINSDIEWYNTFKTDDEKYQIAAFSMQPNNGQLNIANSPFAKMYEGIERANLAIKDIRTYGKPEENAEMAYLLGEALTLRALLYYDMTKLWGDLPARFEPVTTETTYMAKSSRDVIYKQILADLEEAFDYLPWPGATAATSRTDRINKMFAQGLYARIALMASGYARRPDDGMEGTGDLGTNRLSNDPELQKSVLYPKVLGYLREAIQSKTASLESDYEQYWKNQSNLNNLNAGPAYETLYVIPFSDGRGRWNYCFAVRSQGSSYAGGSTVNRGGDAGPVPTMWFRYAEGDQRRDVTCVNWRWNENDEPELAGFQRWYFGKYRFDWMTSNPYSGGNDDGVKPVVLRYADILLMAAEVANEQGELAEAKDYLKEVRERAFLGHEDEADAYVDAIGSKSAMFDAIVEERALEFCGEMTRRFDLMRWNMLKSKLDEAKADMKALRNLSGKYAYVNGLGGNIYWQTDGTNITIYGFNGETTRPSGVWNEEKEYITKVLDSKNKPTGLYDELIDGIYARDPDQYMFWPIFNNNMSDSQRYLRNDYGYTSLD